MKYICLGYREPGKFEGMTEDERHAVLDDCFEYNENAYLSLISFHRLRINTWA